MNLKELNDFIGKVLKESMDSGLNERVYTIRNKIGDGTTVEEIVRRMDDNSLSKIIDQIELEYDIKKEEPQPKETIPTHRITGDMVGNPVDGSTSPEDLDEKRLTAAETEKKEEIVKSMKSTSDKVADLKKRYGKNWTNVVYGVATKRAKKLAENENVEDEMSGFITTLIMNRMGHIHMWQGKQSPEQVSKYNYTVNGKESDIYSQSQFDIEAIMEYLTPEEKEELENGWTVVTNKIPSDYFQIDEEKEFDDVVNSPEASGLEAPEEDKKSMFDSINQNFLKSFEADVREELTKTDPGDKLLAYFDKSLNNESSSILKYIKKRFNSINKDNHMSVVSKDVAQKLRDAWYGV